MKKTITLKQLTNLVKEGTAPRRRAGRATEKFTVRYTNNDQACDAGPNSYFTAKVDGPLNNALNFCAYFMTMGMAEENGSLSRKQYQEALQSGDWEVVSDEEAIQAMDDADVTQGCPVIFWIKDATGTEVYVYEYSEEEFKSWDEEDPELDDQLADAQTKWRQEDPESAARYDAHKMKWNAIQEVNDKFQISVDTDPQRGVAMIYDDTSAKRIATVDYDDWKANEAKLDSSCKTKEEYAAKYEAYLRSLIPALDGGA